MTTQTTHMLSCECGHEGFLDAEEDGSRAIGLWIHYSLRGFSGGSLTLINHSSASKDVLEQMAPRCPACGRVGKVMCSADGCEPRSACERGEHESDAQRTHG
ncbi:hypothetical protein ABGN05_09075 [Aquibium sp. LZ166]|uniref:Uncharacterized protein n=1 Tax=Aquibium pacificus TaxID=3153579 RepID=A0ABV3SIS3_9HYPH